VIVRTGLIRREVAEESKEARIDQIFIDVIGDDDTVRNDGGIKNVAPFREIRTTMG
jgi:uncharacterized radical SAM superfamily protein